MEKEEKNIEVELFSSMDEIEINQICAILENNNIPFIRRDSGSGSYMNFYMGQSIQEKRISVMESDYEKSLNLIMPFLDDNIGENDVVDEKNLEEDNCDEYDDEIEIEKEKYNSIKRTFGYLYFGLPLILIIMLIIAALI